MRLKSFYAKTMTEAMQMIRETLGDEAIIVATREEKGGKAVRVTAAIDPSTYDDREFARPQKTHEHREPAFEVGGRTQATAAETWLQYDDEQDESAVAEDITDALLRHAVPEDVMDHILSCATVIGFEHSGPALVAAIEHLFHFAPMPLKPLTKALMFVGPPGSGKTLAVAKAAARGTMAGLKMGVITTDTVRAGGVEQLQAFTKLLHIDLKRGENPAHLRDQITTLHECDQVLIDTAGINPFNTDDIKILARLLMGNNGAGDVTPLLVLPAGMDAEESGETARVFATLGVSTLLPSRIDIARRLGGILSAAHHGGMNFTDASATPKVADGFTTLTPETLSKLLMPASFRSTPPAKTLDRHYKTGTRS